MEIPTLPCVLDWFLELFVIRFNNKDAFSFFPHCGGLGFLKIQCCFWHGGPKLWPQMIRSGFCWIFFILQEVHHSALWTLWIVSMSLTKFRSTSTFQFSSTRCSCNTSSIVSVDLVPSMYFSGMENVSSLNSRFDVITRLLREPSLRLMVEFRPNFLEYLLWDLRSLLVDSVLKRELSDSMIYCAISDPHLFTLSLPLHWIFEHGFLLRPNFPAPQCLRPWCLFSKCPTHTMHVQRIQATFSCQFDVVLTGLAQK